VRSSGSTTSIGLAAARVHRRRRIRVVSASTRASRSGVPGRTEPPDAGSERRGPADSGAARRPADGPPSGRTGGAPCDAVSAVLGLVAGCAPGARRHHHARGIALLAVVLEVAPKPHRPARRLIETRRPFAPSGRRRAAGPEAARPRSRGGTSPRGLFFAPRYAAAAIVVGGLRSPAAALTAAGSAKAPGSPSPERRRVRGRARQRWRRGGSRAAGGRRRAGRPAVVERVPWRGADNILVPLAVGGTLAVLGA